MVVLRAGDAGEEHFSLSIGLQVAVFVVEDLHLVVAETITRLPSTQMPWAESMSRP